MNKNDTKKENRFTPFPNNVSINNFTIHPLLFINFVVL